jgi:hypothetical protein
LACPTLQLLLFAGGPLAADPGALGSLVTPLCQQLFGAFDADLAFCYQFGCYPIDVGPFGPGGYGDLAGVQGHVAALDAFGGQGADGGKVLR